MIRVHAFFANKTDQLFLLLLNSGFNRFVYTLLILYCLDIINIATGTLLPLGILYGPLLFLSISKSIEKEFVWVHLVPFVSLFTLRLILYLNVCSFEFSYYIFLYYLALIASLLSYSKMIQSERKKNEHLNVDQEDLITELTYVFVLTSFMIFISIIDLFYIFDFTFTPLFIFIGLQIVGILLIIRYIVSGRKKSASGIAELKEPPAALYKNFTLDDERVEKYRQVIFSYFEESDYYLSAEFTLDSLSQELEIPKHHLSQYFSIHLKKNFYRLLAEYRIRYAVIKLEKENNLKIESIAYECGYSSKTSFNKWFKEIMNCTPTEFIAKLDYNK